MTGLTMLFYGKWYKHKKNPAETGFFCIFRLINAWRTGSVFSLLLYRIFYVQPHGYLL